MRGEAWSKKKSYWNGILRKHNQFGENGIDYSGDSQVKVLFMSQYFYGSQKTIRIQNVRILFIRINSSPTHKPWNRSSSCSLQQMLLCSLWKFKILQRVSQWLQCGTLINLTHITQPQDWEYIDEDLKHSMLWNRWQITIREFNLM